ncbi:barstar family protein [Chryseobacterium sp.]|uniref:barstar family protein n=1 Tax=Chryseobacterium sp. TaxID=1871047 RepID=UPI0024E20F3A|nr:barstar family protein [Chryseobacterium sp.]
MKILLNNKDLGISYIKLTRNKNIIEDQLLMKVNGFYQQDVLDLIEYKGNLSIEVESKNSEAFCLYKTTFITNYIFASDDEDEVNEDILLNINMMNNESILGGGYNQYIVDIFYNWERDVEINWNEIDDIETKNNYLRACYLWNASLFTLKDVKDVYIDGKLINCREDIYYQLGELLIGKRGYFGSNLDALEDYLIDIVKNNEIDTTIIFNDTDVIIRNTSNYFFETLIYLLEKAKFKIEIR